MTRTLLRTWNADRHLEEWARPQDGVWWGLCEGCGDEDWVAYVSRFNLCATCDRLHN